MKRLIPQMIFLKQNFFRYPPNIFPLPCTATVAMTKMGPVKNLIPDTPKSGSICQSDDRISGSTGNGANTRQNSFYNRVFLKNIHFTRNKTVLLNGPLTPPVFRTGDWRFPKNREDFRPWGPCTRHVLFPPGQFVPDYPK